MVPSRFITGTVTAMSGANMCSLICAMTCAASECSRCAGATKARVGDVAVRVTIEALTAESIEANVARIFASTVDMPRLDMMTSRCPSTLSMPRIAPVPYLSTACNAGVNRTPNLSMASVRIDYIVDGLAQGVQPA